MDEAAVLRRTLLFLEVFILWLSGSDFALTLLSCMIFAVVNGFALGIWFYLHLPLARRSRDAYLKSGFSCLLRVNKLVFRNG